MGNEAVMGQMTKNVLPLDYAIEWIKYFQEPYINFEVGVPRGLRFEGNDMEYYGKSPKKTRKPKDRSERDFIENCFDILYPLEKA